MAPSFERLPNELLYMVASYLELKDKKTFRLLCRRCTPMPLADLFRSCTPMPLADLFRSIGFSRLRRDRDAFEMIAAHPHLAGHVHELVWYELQLEAWDPAYLPKKKEEEEEEEEGDWWWNQTDDDDDDQEEEEEEEDEDEDEDNDNDDTRAMGELLNAAFQDPDVFWIPKYSGRAWVEEATTYRGKFIRLLKSFPKLTAFASYPMLDNHRGGGGRDIIMYRGYPLSTDLFTLHFTPRNIGGNSGFWSYLLAAMDDDKFDDDDDGLLSDHYHHQQHKHHEHYVNITSLRIVDERFGCHSLLHNEQTLHMRGAFGSLTSIDICLNAYVLLGVRDANNNNNNGGGGGGGGGGGAGDTALLAKCLRAARQLRHLRLGFQKSRLSANILSEAAAAGGGPRPRQRPIVCELLNVSFWPHLTSVHLAGGKPDAKGPNRRWLVSHMCSFLGRHAATLRSLTLEDYLVGPQDIQLFRSVAVAADGGVDGGLHLDSVEITWPGHTGCLVEESQLLPYLNNTAERCDTQYGDLASLAWMENVVLVTENDEVDDEEEEDEEKEDDDDNDKDEDEELSCISHSEVATGGGDNATGNGNDNGNSNGNSNDNGNGQDGNEHRGEYNTYERQPLYVPPPEGAEDDYNGLLYSEYKLHRKLERTAAKQDSDRSDGHDDNANANANANDSGNDNDDHLEVSDAEMATRRWTFTHRDGRQATGGDPLEYFSDWDSDEGDESTPYA